MKRDRPGTPHAAPFAHGDPARAEGVATGAGGERDEALRRPHARGAGERASGAVRDKAADYGSVLWASAYKGKVAHKIRLITVAEWLPPNEVRWPGKIERPRTMSAPPPPEARVGETLHLPLGQPVKAGKAKRPKPATSKAYETPEAEMRSVAQKRGSTIPPPPNGKGRR